jgi:septal ring factor EnvC (AmiA/AmiB activator)
MNPTQAQQILTTAIATNSNEATALNLALSIFEDTFKEDLTALTNAQEESNKIASELSVANGNVATLTAELETANASITTLTGQLTDAQTALTTEQTAHSTDNTNNETTITGLNTQVADLTAQVDSLQAVPIPEPVPPIDPTSDVAPTN